MIRGMISGHQTLKQAAFSAIQQMVARELESDATILAHKLALYAADALGFTTAETEKQAAQSTTATIGLAELAMKALKAIGTYAAEAFAAAYQSAAAIPYVGWILGPAAGAGAMAAVMGVASSVSAAGGMLEVPSDNFMISAHAGESVLPANIAGPMRDFFDGSGGGNNASPTVVNLNVSAVDGQSVANLFKNNAGVITQVIAGAVRNSNAALSGALKSS
jgi:hypothetical protein